MAQFCSPIFFLLGVNMQALEEVCAFASACWGAFLMAFCQRWVGRASFLMRFLAQLGGPLGCHIHKVLKFGLGLLYFMLLDVLGFKIVSFSLGYLACYDCELNVLLVLLVWFLANGGLLTFVPFVLVEYNGLGFFSCFVCAL